MARNQGSEEVGGAVGMAVSIFSQKGRLGSTGVDWGRLGSIGTDQSTPGPEGAHVIGVPDLFIFSEWVKRRSGKAAHDHCGGLMHVAPDHARIWSQMNLNASILRVDAACWRTLGVEREE